MLDIALATGRAPSIILAEWTSYEITEAMVNSAMRNREAKVSFESGRDAAIPPDPDEPDPLMIAAMRAGHKVIRNG